MHLPISPSLLGSHTGQVFQVIGQWKIMQYRFILKCVPIKSLIKNPFVELLTFRKYDPTLKVFVNVDSYQCKVFANFYDKS